MSYKIDGSTIMLTQGDTFRAKINIINPKTEEEYTPVEGDKLRFAMKRKYTDEVPVILKDIPIDTMILGLEPDDTKYLDYTGKYVYDVQLTMANGDILTVIPDNPQAEATLYIYPEVD